MRTVGGSEPVLPQLAMNRYQIKGQSVISTKAKNDEKFHMINLVLGFRILKTQIIVFRLCYVG